MKFEEISLNKKKKKAPGDLLALAEELEVEVTTVGFGRGTRFYWTWFADSVAVDDGSLTRLAEKRGSVGRSIVRHPVVPG